MLRKTLATLWLLVACAGPAAAASVWFADNANLYRVDPATNKANKTLANAGVVAIASGSGDTWAIVGTQLKRYDASGTLGLTVSLATVGVVQPQLLQVDPYDKSVWLSGAAGMAHLDRAGQLIATRTLSTPAGAMALHADQGMWAMVGKALTRVSPAGAVVASRDLTGIVATNPALLAIDSILGYAWIGDGASLVRVDLGALAAPPSVFATGAAIDRIGVHPKTGQAWVVQGTTLKIFAATGALQATIGLGASGLQSVRSIAYDETNRAFWLGDQAGLFRFSEAGAFVAKVDKAVPVQALAGEAFSILPTLSILKPVDGSITSNTRPPIVLGLDAKCAAGPCALPPNYPDGYQVNATLDSLAIGGLFQFDPATGRTTYTPNSPLPAGTHALAALVTDEFGHSTAVLNSAFRVEAVNPAAPGQCATTPTVVPNASFVPFAALERLEIRGGRPAGADWEWGLGTNTQQSGKFVNENLDWVSGRAYQWTLSYDGAGSGRMTVIDGNTTLFSRAFTGSLTEGLRAGNAINFYVKATADSGAATVALSVNEVNGAPVAGSLITAGSGVFSDAALTLAIPLSSHGFTAGGTITLNFPGASPPQGSRLNAIVTAGNIACAANRPPVVALIQPAAGTQMQAPAGLTLEAQASDPDGTVAKVEFFANGATTGTALAAPYLMGWYGELPGTYSFTATATDNQGATGTSAPVTVTLTAPPTPATIEFTSPVQGVVVGAGDLVVADVMVTLGTRPVSRVEICYGPSGSTATCQVVSGPPYRLEIHPIEQVAWYFCAWAWYATPIEGQVNATVACRSFSVRPNVAPFPRIASPYMMSRWMAPATIPVRVEANDSDGVVQKIELYADGVKIGESASGLLEFNWQAVPAGTHLLKAVATDTLGGARETSTVAVLVGANAGYTLPNVSLASPVTGVNSSSLGRMNIAVDALDPEGRINYIAVYRGPDRVATLAPPNFSASVDLAPNNVSPRARFDVWATAFDGANRPIASTKVARVTAGTPAPGARFTGERLESPASINEGEEGSITFDLSFADQDRAYNSTLFLRPVLDYGDAFPFAIYYPFSADGRYRVSFAGLLPGMRTFAIEATAGDNTISWSSAFSIDVNAKPQAYLTLPLGNRSYVLPASLMIEAVATDSDGTLTKVEFFDNETLLATLTGPPYRYLWTNPPLGTHQIAVVATDNRGATAANSTSPFFIVATNPPPEVSIRIPENGSSLTYILDEGQVPSIQVWATATAAAGEIVKVEFFEGTTLLATATDQLWYFSWEGISAGTHTVTARATDSFGASTTSAPSTFTVAFRGANQPPQITILTPPRGSDVVGPGLLTITAEATDDVRVEEVRFYRGSNLLSTFASPPYSIVVSNLTPGYAMDGIRAVASDDTGLEATIGAEFHYWDLHFDAPASGTDFVVGATIPIRFSAQGGRPIKRIELYSGATLLSAFDYSDSATVRTVDYSWTNVPAGNYSITAKVLDASDKALLSRAVAIVVSDTELSVDAGFDGSTVADEVVTISGRVRSQRNSSVIVNGRLATMTADGTWIANSVPLKPGLNQIPVILNSQDFDPIVRTISITSAGSNPFEVSLLDDRGIAPFSTSVFVRTRSGAPFARVEVDVNNDGIADSSAVPGTDGNTSFKLDFSDPGSYTVRIRLFDDQNNVLLSSVLSIVVSSFTDRAQTVKQIYADLLSRLAAGTLPSAMRTLTASAQDQYGPVFTLLGDSLAAEALAARTIGRVMIAPEFAELTVTKSEDGQLRAFRTYLIQGEDGIWRIDSM